MPNYGWRKQSNAVLIQIDASSFTEFEISEFEISRVDCIHVLGKGMCEKRPSYKVLD